MNCKKALRRFSELKKLATGVIPAASSIAGAVYLGNKMGDSAELERGLLNAAYEVDQSGGTIDEAIDSANTKKTLGVAIATLAAALAKTKSITAKQAVPAALLSLGLANMWRKDEARYKELKGKQLLLNDLKDM